MKTGVTVIVAVTGESPEFVVAKAVIFPVPLAAKPMPVVLFVQLKIVPETTPVKLMVEVKPVLQTT